MNDMITTTCHLPCLLTLPRYRVNSTYNTHIAVTCAIMPSLALRPPYPLQGWALHETDLAKSITFQCSYSPKLPLDQVQLRHFGFSRLVQKDGGHLASVSGFFIHVVINSRVELSQLRYPAMDSFEKHGLDEDAFGDKGLSSLRTFDAFRMYPVCPRLGDA